jgi:hypothetical protein
MLGGAGRIEERWTTRETQTMCYTGDLRYDFNATMNIISYLTNNIKLLSLQILQHGQEADLSVRCDVLLDGFRSAERSYVERKKIRLWQLLGVAAATIV